MTFKTFSVGALLALSTCLSHAGELFISVENRTGASWNLVPATPPQPGSPLGFSPIRPLPEDLPGALGMHLAPRGGRTFLVMVPADHAEVMFMIQPREPGSFATQWARIPVGADADSGLIAPVACVLTAEGILGSLTAREPAVWFAAGTSRLPWPMCALPEPGAMAATRPASGGAAERGALPPGMGAGVPSPPATASKVSGHGAPGAAKDQSDLLAPEPLARLQAWFQKHHAHPFPDRSELETLAWDCGLPEETIAQWFASTRKRIWWPWLDRAGSVADLFSRPIPAAAAGLESGHAHPADAPSPGCAPVAAPEKIDALPAVAGKTPPPGAGAVGAGAGARRPKPGAGEKGKGRKRKMFSPKDLATLQDWFKKNLKKPYLTGEGLNELAKKTSHTPQEIAYWLGNTRNRCWFPWQRSGAPEEAFSFKPLRSEARGVRAAPAEQ